MQDGNNTGRGVESLKGSGQQKKDSPLSYVADLFRLNLISEKVLGKEPLSRGTRESHFAESIIFAMCHYDEPNTTKCVRLSRYMALARRMRELSPQEEGKQIEVISRLLSPAPHEQLILGSPYDEQPAGAFSFITDSLGKKRGR